MPNDTQGNPPVDDQDVVVIDQNDTEAAKKALETTLAQKKHWRSKAIDPTSGKSYKELFEEMKNSAQKPPAQTTTNGGEQPKPGSDFDALADNLEVVRDLRGDELSELRTTSRELGVDPVKYIKSKAGQAHLKEIRATRKADDATPGSSSRIPTFNGKPVKDVLRDEKASENDKQAAFEARLKGRGLNQNQ